MHQGQETASLPVGKAFAREPVQVVARQVGDQSTLMFAEWHFACNQQFEIGGLHPGGSTEGYGQHGRVIKYRQYDEACKAV